MPKKNLLMLLAILSSLLASCASVPDKPSCIEINPIRGWCTNPISEHEFFIDEENLYEGKTWWELRPYMILMPLSTYEATKTFLIKSCKKSQQCEKSIAKWERKFKKAEDQLKSKEPKK